MASTASTIANEAVNRTAGAGQSAMHRHEGAGAPEAPAETVAFDYKRAAELFPTRSRKPRRNPVTYKRFKTAAEALRFAIEELPSDLLLGAYLQVDEDRFGSAGIRRLYESEQYPLKRRVTAPR